ncbi:MAG: TPM domain-containing protein [Thermoplasmatota archaeon]
MSRQADRNPGLALATQGRALLVAALALLATATPLAAQGQPAAAACGLHVVDEAGVYSDAQEAQITAELCRIEQETGAQVYLILLSSHWEAPDVLTARLDGQFDATRNGTGGPSLLLAAIASYGPSGLPALWLHVDPELQAAVGPVTLRQAERAARQAGDEDLGLAAARALAVITRGLQESYGPEGFPEPVRHAVAPERFWAGTLAFCGLIGALALTASVLRRPDRR